VDDARIARTILDLPDARALMPEVRRVAAAMAAAGRPRVTQRGVDVEATTARGAIRLGRPRPGGS